MGKCSWFAIWFQCIITDSIFYSLIIPFLRLGEAVTGSGHSPLTADALKNVLTGHASNDVMLGWLIAAPFVLGALYTVSLPCFKILVDRFDRDIPNLCWVSCVAKATIEIRKTLYYQLSRKDIDNEKKEEERESHPARQETGNEKRSHARDMSSG